MADRHVVAMGGGGFSFGTEWEGLDRFVLSLVDKKTPKVLFLPTATGDSAEYIVRFYNGFADKGCALSHLELFTRTVVDLRSLLMEQDVVYVGGGNTANMLAVWRLHGVDDILRDAWANGTVMTGESAGGLCWFEGGTTDSFGLDLSALNDGLDIIKGSFSPHYDGEARRRPRYHEFVGNGSLPDGIAADNGCGLHFVDTELAEAVSLADHMRAYHVRRVDDGVDEEPITPRVLSNASKS